MPQSDSLANRKEALEKYKKLKLKPENQLTHDEKLHISNMEVYLSENQ